MSETLCFCIFYQASEDINDYKLYRYEFDRKVTKDILKKIDIYQTKLLEEWTNDPDAIRYKKEELCVVKKLLAHPLLVIEGPPEDADIFITAKIRLFTKQMQKYMGRQWFKITAELSDAEYRGLLEDIVKNTYGIIKDEVGKELLLYSGSQTRD